MAETISTEFNQNLLNISYSVHVISSICFDIFHSLLSTENWFKILIVSFRSSWWRHCTNRLPESHRFTQSLSSRCNSPETKLRSIWSQTRAECSSHVRYGTYRPAPSVTWTILKCIPLQSEVLELVRNLVESVVKSDVALGTGEKTGLVSDTEVVEQTTTPDPFADEDEDMFNGFCEPFDEPAAPAIDDTAASTPVFTVGSDEWSRGVARDSDGRIVHVSPDFHASVGSFLFNFHEIMLHSFFYELIKVGRNISLVSFQIVAMSFSKLLHAQALQYPICQVCQVVLVPRTLWH